MFDFLRRKSLEDRLRDYTVMLDPDKHYIMVVPDEGVDPQELLDTGFFEDYNVFIIQASKITIMEIE